MDPALQELLDAGEATAEVAIVVRLRDAGEAPAGLRIVARLGPIATARIERSAVWQIYGHPAVASVKAPRWLVSEYGPFIDREAAENVGVTDADRRRPDGLQETGRGAVIGVIDWGCDFAHPDFVTAGGDSRLLALWDQRTTMGSGNPYGYGRILRKSDLSAAIKADDPYAAAGYHPARSDTGVGAHGTHVLGIAAGNGRGGGPLGIAPDAELVFVHLGAPGWERAGPLGDSSNVLEALHFVVSEAGDRPLVVNLSIGRHGGPHDGSTVVEQAIDWLVRARPGTAVVQSTGNYFSRNVHSAGQLRNGETDELEFQVSPGDTTPNELEVWYPGCDVFEASLIAPDGRRVAAVKQNAKTPVVIDGARVGTLYHRTRDPNNGDHHIDLFQYPNAPPGTWRLALTGDDVSDGRYHAWVERDPGCKVCQALFAPENARHTETTGSICNGLQTIAVGAYDAHDPARGLAPFSSSGPTRDGRVRPVLLAPGVRVLSARSHPRSGTASLLTRMSGTSMAAPHVSGTIALMFEAGGRLDIVQIRRALFETLDPAPADDPRDAHRAGFGILNIADAVKRAAALASARTSAIEGAASIGESTEAARDAVAAESEEEVVMNPACCGEACKTCEWCKVNPCETCPCCHALPAQASAAHAEDASALRAPDAADEPVVQIVPSPLEGFVPPILEADDAAHEPIIQVVPSPLVARGEAIHAPSPEFAAATGAAPDAADFEPAAPESELPHPIDAAEALIDAGASDATEFLAQSLGAAGQRWPAGCSVRSLFDDLAGRTTASRRLQMDRHFEVIGRPGRRLVAALQPGDIVIRRGEGRSAHSAMVAHPLLYSEPDARAHGLLLEGPSPGLYAHVVEPGPRPRPGQARFARRVSRADGTVLPDTLVVRARAEAAEAADEAAPDPNIRWLQTALNRAIGAGLVVDGLVGPATRDAVRRYQAARGLQVDGIVGTQTLQALRSDVYGGPPATPPGYPSPPTYTPPTYTPPPYTPPPPPSYTPPPPTYRPPQYTPPPPPGYTPPTTYPPADGSNGTCRTFDRFGYDSAALTAGHRAALGELAQRIVASGATVVTLTGYASPEGTQSYNLALGRRRAEGVAAALRQAIDRVRAGAAATIRFDVRSEGEARQVSHDGPANRRVEVCYAEPPPPRPTPPPRPRPVPPQPRVLTRYSVESPQGQAMLQRYAEAVRRMMALPGSNPMSWVFQWYTHWVRSDRTKAAEIVAIFGSGASPSRTLADRMWNSCRAHFNFGTTDELFFLPWHRMYVDFFERICRRVLDDGTFTLPYWNYTSGSNTLPAPFRDPGSPLFRANRNPGVNQGRPIDEGQPRGTLSAERALMLPNYGGRDDEPGFNDFLDGRPHGVVHSLVGTAARGMGSIEWAAQDPIFWLHHCNIDRIWASWNNAGRRNPSDASWLGRSFTFADQNGQAVTATVRDFASTAARGYTYDQFETVPPPTAAEMAEAGEPDRQRRRVMRARSIAAPPGGIPLGRQAIKVNLRRAARESVESDEAGERPRRVFLVIKNYRANVQPGILYHVYLALPPGTAGQAAERHYVGPLSFFDAVPHAGHAGAFVGRTARFDVTDIADRLRAAGQFEAPSVTVAPAGAPAASAQPVIGEISLVEQ